MYDPEGCCPCLEHTVERPDQQRGPVGRRFTIATSPLELETSRADVGVLL